MKVLSQHNAGVSTPSFRGSEILMVKYTEKHGDEQVKLPIFHTGSASVHVCKSVNVSLQKS